MERAEAAAVAFRAIGDQEQVDRIVRAMVIAGLEAAVELAELALEETGFGVLEDKVTKNYIATEFLYDHLRDKRSVGVIDEDAERAIEYVAEPIGVVLALLPITNPTSTALFKSIVAAKTRNAVIFRPSARAARCATRAIEILQRAGEAEGLPPGALQVIPDPSLEASQYLFHHPDVDLIWTTGGPKAVAAANAAGKPCISVGAGNAPVYLHASADVPMAVVDLLISKTFDASVICPAEQTCVVDDAIHDAVVAELERLGARVLDPAEVERLAAAVFDADGRPALAALGRSCADLAGAGRDRARRREDPRRAAARRPRGARGAPAAAGEADARARARALAVRRARARRLRAGDRARRPRAHLGGLRPRRGRRAGVRRAHPHRPHPRQRADRGRRARRHLHRHAADVLARLRHLGRLDHDGEHQLPQPAQRQGRLAPPGAAAVVPRAVGHLLQRRRARRPARRWTRAIAVIVTRRADTQARGAVDEVRRHLGCEAVHVIGDVEPEPGEACIRAGAELLDRLRPDLLVAVGGGSVIDAAKAMRLFHEHPEVTLRELTLPFLDARKRVARYPQGEHSVRLVAVPTTSGTGSEVSPPPSSPPATARSRSSTTRSSPTWRSSTRR